MNTLLTKFLAIFIVLSMSLPSFASDTAGQKATLAPTPPMGWNSWDSYGPTVTEKEVKANADFMAENLSKYGWKYIIVDIEWYQPKARAHGYIPRGEVSLDDYGRFLPSANRFPS